MSLQTHLVLGRDRQLLENLVVDFHNDLTTVILKQIAVLATGQFFHQMPLKNAWRIILRAQHVNGPRYCDSNARPFKTRCDRG